MKLLYALFLTLSLTFATLSTVNAQDVILNEAGRDDYIYGEITDISYDSFDLRIDDDLTLEVGLDNLKLESGTFEDFFDVGDHVRVIGTVKDDFIEAEQVAKY